MADYAGEGHAEGFEFGFVSVSAGYTDSAAAASAVQTALVAEAGFGETGPARVAQLGLVAASDPER